MFHWGFQKEASKDVIQGSAFTWEGFLSSGGFGRRGDRPDVSVLDPTGLIRRPQRYRWIVVQKIKSYGDVDNAHVRIKTLGTHWGDPGKLRQRPSDKGTYFGDC